MAVAEATAVEEADEGAMAELDETGAGGEERKAERGWSEKTEIAQGPPQMSGESKQYQLQEEGGSWTVVGAREFPHYRKRK